MRRAYISRHWVAFLSLSAVLDGHWGHTMRLCKYFLPLLLLVLCPLVLHSAAVSGRTDVEAGIDAAAISGYWSGFRMTTQLGQCPNLEPVTRGTSLTNDGKTHIIPVKMKVTAHPDGDFVVEELPEDPSDDYPKIMVGKITPDLRISVVRNQSAICDGQPRGYQTILTGILSLKKQGARIKLEGIKDKCPATECRFRVTVDIKKDLRTSASTEERK